MHNILTLPKNSSVIKSSIVDALGIAFVYFIPSISHLFSFPVYLFEPMRIILILSMVHSSKRNAYLLAITLPLFSFISASHPVFIKSLLITCEMTINVWLFYFLLKKIPNFFIIAFVSIILSKTFYYSGKFILIKLSLFSTELIDTPLIIQLSLTLILSIYAFFILSKKKAV